MGDIRPGEPYLEQMENVEAYAGEMPEWHMREKVKGGLTGYAQAIGRYNISRIKPNRIFLCIEQDPILIGTKLFYLTVRILFSKESTEGFDAVEMQKNRECWSML